ncbi:MAG: single-stranded DNA-binding protein [Candidatus Cloacimonadota bacterium]|nr:MAG: single-stranded DNA-binding protein [Candidatus Cloacimonadota bacterium]
MAGELKFPRINNIIVSGRLTRDIDLRYTSSGVAVAQLGIAFDRAFQKDGKWQNESSFIDVVVWNQKAEQCAENLRKGSPVIVDGYLQTRNYTTKDNQNRKITEIVANKIHFLEWSPGGHSSENGSFESQNLEEPEPFSSNDVTGDDVPF